MFKNTLDNKRYYTLNYYYKKTYGSKVFKVALNGGFSCPNKDGKKGTGGCIYCSPSGSGDFAGNINEDILTQFENIKNMMLEKWPDAKYIGYFQANSNTYASVDKLKELYEPILNVENVVGLNIATRSDCFNEDIYNYLEDLNKRTDLVIELGLQSSKEETIEYINRKETKEEFESCINELKKRNIKYVIHIINGLPGETKEDMINTAKYVNSLNPFGIKIHMLHVIKNTKLGDIYLKNPFHILTKDEYIDIVINQLEYLDENIVINRITGDPVKEDLIEPTWLLKKFVVLNDIDKEMVKRDTYQGSKIKETK
jgi:radical SAM protein (TIGR01212 family)